MRAPVVGLACVNRPFTLVARAKDSALVTHAHPLAQEAAVLIALATSQACIGRRPIEILESLRAQAQRNEFSRRLEVARDWLSSRQPEPAAVRRDLGNGITATESAVTAIHIALRFLDASFDDLLAFVAACKGDVDTIGAMAGAIWGAYNGSEALPANSIARLEQADRIRDVAEKLYAMTMSPQTA